jgi:hypothetical protein
MELGVYVWSIICGHIDWTGNIELYKSMSLMCKTLYKAVRYGATPYVRWDTEKNIDLLFRPEKFFFGDKIRALVISKKHLKEANKHPNIDDVKVLIDDICPGSEERVNFGNFLHLHVHILESAQTGDLLFFDDFNENLKTLQITQDRDFLHYSKRGYEVSIALPVLFPNSLEKVVIRVVVENGLDHLSDQNCILPSTLKHFEFSSCEADDRFFRFLPPEKLETLILNSCWESIQETGFENLPKTHLKKFILIDYDCETSEEETPYLNFNMNEYPSLEYFEFNKGNLKIGNKSIKKIETGYYSRIQQDKNGEINDRITVSKVYFRKEKDVLSLKKKKNKKRAK